MNWRRSRAQGYIWSHHSRRNLLTTIRVKLDRAKVHSTKRQGHRYLAFDVMSSSKDVMCKHCFGLVRSSQPCQCDFHPPLGLFTVLTRQVPRDDLWESTLRTEGKSRSSIDNCFLYMRISSPLPDEDEKRLDGTEVPTTLSHTANIHPGDTLLELPSAYRRVVGHDGHSDSIKPRGGIPEQAVVTTQLNSIRWLGPKTALSKSLPCRPCMRKMNVALGAPMSHTRAMYHPDDQLGSNRDFRHRRRPSNSNLTAIANAQSCCCHADIPSTAVRLLVVIENHKSRQGSSWQIAFPTEHPLRSSHLSLLGISFVVVPPCFRLQATAILMVDASWRHVVLGGVCTFQLSID
ncbi:hypothetical protein Ae201684_013971 [Aphanomyces euteiches]|uniref:Uncharacterized protein n=1 Tax=Aphanomyces euteiches TaxID=100861 RepID=A0A6G0WLJ4_9STRA|nr:hypothetical protein Ae201684_013971 [Aphanomyces euteiches]